MRAVIAEAGSVKLVSVEDPSADRADGSAVLTVARTGICGSDLHMVANGMAPVAIGHEFGVWMPDGTLAAVRPTGECGRCDPCSRGFQNTCADTWSRAHGISMHGGLADMVAVELSRMFPMPQGSRPVDAALVEPMAVALHGVRRGNPEPGDRVLVTGAGSIGLLVIAALRASGTEVDVVSRHSHQSAAAERLGARVIDSPRRTTYMCAFDAAGTQQTLDACIAACRPGGRVTELGMFWEPVQLGNAMMLNEITVIPAMVYTHGSGHHDFMDATAILGADPGIADAIVTHEFPLADAEVAFRTARDRSSGAIKVHLVP